MGIYMNKSDGRSLKVALEKSQCVRGAVFAGGLSEASEEQAALGTRWDFFPHADWWCFSLTPRCHLWFYSVYLGAGYACFCHCKA